MKISVGGLQQDLYTKVTLMHRNTILKMHVCRHDVCTLKMVLARTSLCWL